MITKELERMIGGPGLRNFFLLNILELSSTVVRHIIIMQTDPILYYPNLTYPNLSYPILLGIKTF